MARIPASNDAHRTYIHALPPELLFEIFTYLRHGSLHPDPLGAFREEWVRVTWVCRRWRDVALSRVTLWDTLSLSPDSWSPEAIQTYLDRGRGLTPQYLYVHGADLTGNQLGEAFSLIAANPRRTRMIETFHATFEPGQVLVVQPFLGAMGPRLTELRLLCDSYWTAEPVGLELDGRSVPSLRVLRLTTVTLTPASQTSFPNLIQLEVTDLFADHYNDAVQRRLHALLVAVPNLERLVLDSSVPFEDTYIPEFTPVELPNLQHLTLKVLAPEIAEALDHLNLPHSASLHIIADLGSDFTEIEGDDWLYCLFRGRNSGQPHLLQETRSIGMWLGSSSANSDLVIHGSPAPSLEENPLWSVKIPSFASFWNGPNMLAGYSASALNHLPTFVPARQIVHLELHVASALPLNIPRGWVAWLHDVPHLQHLAVGGCELVCCILATLCLEDGEGREPLLTKLKQVCLCIATWPGKPYDIDIEILRHWLYRRVGRGLETHVSLRAPAGADVNPPTMALVCNLLSSNLIDKVFYDTCPACHTTFNPSVQPEEEDAEEDDGEGSESSGESEEEEGEESGNGSEGEEGSSDSD